MSNNALAIIFIHFMRGVNGFLGNCYLLRLTGPVELCYLCRVLRVRVVPFRIFMMAYCTMYEREVRSIVFDHLLRDVRVIIWSTFINEETRGSVFSLRVLMVDQLLTFFVRIVGRGSRVVLLLNFRIIYGFQFNDMEFPMVRRPNVNRMMVRLLFMKRLLEIRYFRGIFHLNVRSSRQRHKYPICLGTDGVGNIINDFYRLRSFARVNA